MSNAVIPMDQMTQMANAVARSGLFGAKTVDQALAIMLLAQAEGLHPATAARDYHIIDGKPSMKADAMLARHLQSGGTVKWNEYTDAKVSGTFSHPNGGEVTVDWDNDRIKQAGLSDRPNHKKFPRQMKRARVISEGVRTVNPGVCAGLYSVEEVQDFGATDEAPKAAERDMGTAQALISEAQHKRLEARINELGADRGIIKDLCFEKFGKEHFPELSPAEYEAIDAELPKYAKPLYIVADQVAELERLCTEAKVEPAKFLKMAKSESFAAILSDDYDDGRAFLQGKIDKAKPVADPHADFRAELGGKI